MVAMNQQPSIEELVAAMRASSDNSGGSTSSESSSSSSSASGSSSGSASSGSASGSISDGNNITEDPRIEAERLMAQGNFAAVLGMPGVPADIAAAAVSGLAAQLNIETTAVSTGTSAAPTLASKDDVEKGREPEAKAPEVAPAALPPLMEERELSAKEIMDKAVENAMDNLGPGLTPHQKMAVKTKLTNDIAGAMVDTKKINSGSIEAAEVLEKTMNRLEKGANASLASFVDGRISAGLAGVVLSENYGTGKFTPLANNSVQTPTTGTSGVEQSTQVTV